MNGATASAKLSKNHQLVLEIIQESGRGRHLSMAEVYDRARTRRPGIGFTTVYRAITRLRDQGSVAEISVPGADSAYYEPSGPEHAHFRCTSCGTVEDIDLPEQPMLGDEVRRQLGGSLERTTLTLHGRCSACS